MFEEAGKLRDNIQRESLSELVLPFKRGIMRTKRPSFIIGYCASSSEVYEQVAGYVQEVLSIPEENVLITNVNPLLTSLKDYFTLEREHIERLAGELVLVRAKGFELNKWLTTSNWGRFAHDFDQELAEPTGSGRFYKGVEKKIIVLTHIGHEKMDDGSCLYDIAVRSACQSQFKQFLFESEVKE